MSSSNVKNKFGDIMLLPHQIEVINIIKKVFSVLVLHTTGSGKTITALASALHLLLIKPESHIVVFCPISVIDNFKIELNKLTSNVAYRERPNVINIVNEKIKFFSHHAFLKDMTEICKNSIMIIDEVHNLRTNITKQKGKMSLNAITCAMLAWKLILMTATPIVNSVSDLTNMFRMLLKKPTITISNIEQLRFYCQFIYISMYEGTKYGYPSVKIIEEFVKMNKQELIQYVNFYNNLQKDIDPLLLKRVGKMTSNQYFMYMTNMMRRVGDSGVSLLTPKVKRILEIIKQNKLKTAIYSYWVHAGLDPIIEHLKKLNMKIYKIVGDTSNKERQKIINKFNDEDIAIILFSKAGGEGINLKGVRNIFILEPCWNEVAERQAMARAIRYGSHDHLPPEERDVYVYKMYITAPDDYVDNYGNKVLTMDEHLRNNYVCKKKTLSDEVMLVFREYAE